MCAMIGVNIATQETPPAVLSLFSTANAFMAGRADWGPAGTDGTITPTISLGQATAQIAAPNGGLIQSMRSSTNATLYDSADAYFREGGGTAYFARVVGTNPTKGSLIVSDGLSGTAFTITGRYVGSGSSAIYVLVTLVDSSTHYTITLQDVTGNVLAQSPKLGVGNDPTGATNTNSKFDAITWAATTNLITLARGNANLPAAINSGGAPLSAGTDDFGTTTVTSWANAIATAFPPDLGPGQVMAPAQSNTALPGIWGTLANHAQTNNRVALLDGKDGNTASAAIAEVTTAAVPVAQQSYCGLWTGNLIIPGVIAGTNRVIAPSPVIAALCARADSLGNPNLAAAGEQYPLYYVSGVNTIYAGALSGDIANMNDHGINVFTTVFNVLQNYGFVSLVAVPTNDSIYWQFSHGRLRMAIVFQSRVVGQQFLFDQIDGQGHLTSQFEGALQGMLQIFFAAGALYGQTGSDAYTVDTSSSVNTDQSLAAGQLWANLAVRMSPFGQLVEIVVNVVPITQQLVGTAAASGV